MRISDFRSKQLLEKSVFSIRHGDNTFDLTQRQENGYIRHTHDSNHGSKIGTGGVQYNYNSITNGTHSKYFGIANNGNSIDVQAGAGITRYGSIVTQNVAEESAWNPLASKYGSDNVANAMINKLRSIGGNVVNASTGGLTTESRVKNTSVGVFAGTSGIGANVTHENYSVTDGVAKEGSTFKVGTNGFSAMFHKRQEIENGATNKYNYYSAGVNLQVGSLIPVDVGVGNVLNGRTRYRALSHFGNIFGIFNAISDWAWKRIETAQFMMVRPDDKPRIDAQKDLFYNEKTSLDEPKLTTDGQLHLNKLAENFKAQLAKDPEAKLELGHLVGYKWMQSMTTEDRILSEKRIEVEKQYLISLGIPAESILLEQSNVSADDKRLHVIDNNTNIRIVTSADLVLRTAKNEQAQFSVFRNSPLGEAEFSKFKQSQEFQDFLKTNVIVNRQEKEAVANFLYEAEKRYNGEVSMQQLMEMVKTEVYDKNLNFRTALKTTTLNDKSDMVSEGDNLKFVREQIKSVYPNISDRDLEKELDAFANYVAYKSESDTRFRMELQHNVESGNKNDINTVINLAFKDYTNTLLNNKVMLSQLDDIKDEVYDQLKSISRMNENDIRAKYPDDVDNILKIKGIVAQNNRQENKLLAQRLVETGLSGFNGASFGENFDGKNMGTLLKTTFPMISAEYYDKGQSIVSNLAVNYLGNQSNDNPVVKAMNADLRKQLELSGVGRLSLEEIVTNVPDFRYRRFTGAGMYEDMEVIGRSIYNFAAKQNLNSSALNNGEYSFDRSVKNSMPNIIEPMLRIRGMVEEGVDPKNIRTIFELHENYGQEEAIKIIANNPQLKNIYNRVHEIISGENIPAEVTAKAQLVSEKNSFLQNRYGLYGNNVEKPNWNENSNAVAIANNGAKPEANPANIQSVAPSNETEKSVVVANETLSVGQHKLNALSMANKTENVVAKSETDTVKQVGELSQNEQKTEQEMVTKKPENNILNMNALNAAIAASAEAENVKKAQMTQKHENNHSQSMTLA